MGKVDLSDFQAVAKMLCDRHREKYKGGDSESESGDSDDGVKKIRKTRVSVKATDTARALNTTLTRTRR